MLDSRSCRPQSRGGTLCRHSDDRNLVRLPIGRRPCLRIRSLVNCFRTRAIAGTARNHIAENGVEAAMIVVAVEEMSRRVENAKANMRRLHTENFVPFVARPEIAA